MNGVAKNPSVGDEKRLEGPFEKCTRVSFLIRIYQTGIAEL